MGHTLKKIGSICRRYRKIVLQKNLRDVAIEMGYSVENISAFENGRNDNCLILLWYMKNGLTLKQLCGGGIIE